MSNSTKRTGRPLGSGVRWPFYALQPGEAVVVIADPNRVDWALRDIRRNRGWVITRRKTDIGIEVRRLS